MIIWSLNLIFFLLQNGPITKKTSKIGSLCILSLSILVHFVSNLIIVEFIKEHFETVFLVIGPFWRKKKVKGPNSQLSVWILRVKGELILDNRFKSEIWIFFRVFFYFWVDVFMVIRLGVVVDGGGGVVMMMMMVVNEFISFF